VLPRNPALADRVISWVTGAAGAALPELDSALEERLHAERVHAGSARGLRRRWRDHRLARG
jgi:CobQ-like glutamine amidotransferase family enzyme